MAERFNLPDIGSGLQEAEIVSWLVNVGDDVTTDQVLCEVETEKSVVEIPVPYAGVVLELAGPPGTSVKVGDMLVVIGATGEASPAAADTAAPLAETSPDPAPPTAVHAPVPDLPAERPHAMPLVRKLARERGIDLATVTGTGEADASRLIAARARLSERLGKKIPMDALLVAVVIPALRQFPVANAAVDGDDLLVKDFYDIGVAVGSPDGLLVPIVRDADRLPLTDLVDVVGDLTGRAKERKVRPDEMGDQTFTISNLGGLRGWHATQVIPAGTTGIISFGRAFDRPVARGGSIVSSPVMALSGTFDHRAMDGVEAMGVVNAIVDVIEEPALLLV